MKRDHVPLHRKGWMIKVADKRFVLIVDDVEVNREMLRLSFADDFNILLAENGQEALRLVREKKHEISAVLLDIVMPFLDGVEVVRQLNSVGYTSQIPVLVMTSANKEDYVTEAFSYGAFDVILKPVNPVWARIKINNAMDYFRYKRSLDYMLENRMTDVRRESRQQEIRLEIMREISVGLVQTLCSVIETHDCRARAHIGNVCRLTGELIELVRKKYPEHGLSEEDVLLITYAAAVHDIGKIDLPEAFLKNRNSFGEDEAFRAHPERGWQLLSEIPDFPNRKLLKYCKDICRWHHERWNGKGYPDGLYRHETPIWAQVVGLADAYDSVTHTVFREEAYSEREALGKLQNGDLGTFNPSLLECLRELREKKTV